MATPVVVSRIQNRRGTQTQFNGYVYSAPGPNSLYPAGYNGVGGYYDPLDPVSPPEFTVSNYPNVLMPGELALCTDTRQMFIGNVNGEFIQFSGRAASIVLEPLVLQLLPVPTLTVIPELTFLPTPFRTILYSVTDVSNVDPNAVGVNFARNAELLVTAINTTALLVDQGTEINATSYTIEFEAHYDITNSFIEILYMHNFPSNVTFSTSSIIWVSL
jgi:hypothetical protein